MTKKAEKYTGVDTRGRRTTQSDSRVSEAVKADLPAYGFNGMTFGDITSEKKRVGREREGREEAAGYAKGGVTRADGCVTKGHTKGRMV